VPPLFFAAVLPEERVDVFEPLRAEDRAAVFFEAEREADLPADFAALLRAVVFFAAVFLAVVFFAADFLAAVFLAAVFLAADFLAPALAVEAREVVFLAADFLAALFFEAALLVVLAAVFLAAVFLAADFLAAVFFAPPFLPLELRLFAEVDADPLAPPTSLILMSLGFDLSSVGMNASFKGLRVHRHACKRQRRYIKRVPINGKCPK
jgi:hypothetical protein